MEASGSAVGDVESLCVFGGRTVTIAGGVLHLEASGSAVGDVESLRPNESLFSEKTKKCNFIIIKNHN